MAEVVINNRALAELLRSSRGPLARHLIVIGEAVKLEAQRTVGVKTGNLRNHIVKRFRGVVGGALQVEVGAEVPYALFHHEGTRPHTITGNPLLVFFWGKTGRVMYLPSVQHPGTRGNPFLVRALQTVMARFR